MYTGIATIVKSRIIVTNNALNLIGLNKEEIVFVKKINGKPLDVNAHGTIYNVFDVEFECPITFFTLDSFKVLFDLGLISHDYSDEHKYMLLSELLQCKKDVPAEILDYVYEDAKDKYNLEKLMGLVSNLSSMKWLMSKNVKCCTMPGWGNSMGHLIDRAELNFPNSRDIVMELSKHPELIDIEFLRSSSGKETNLSYIKKRTRSKAVLELCNVAEKML